MSIKDILKEELNKTFTTNGDEAFSSSGSYCLDFFVQIGSLSLTYNDLINSFTKAYYENSLIAIKTMFYGRDIRDGLGKRSYFRFLANYVANFMPDVAKQIISFIPKYGRYDDLFAFINTPVEDDMILFIKKQLEEDLIKKNLNQPISLLGKWMPSINTSNDEARAVARRLCVKLNMSYKDYRKTLKTLRRGIIIENNLRNRDYTFDYSKVPSQAFIKYKQAFMKNDTERFTAFINSNIDGAPTIKTATLYPYQVTEKAFFARGLEETTLEQIWKNFDRSSFSENTIVVRDGSGSMTWSFSTVRPIDVATSIAILFSEQLTGPFKNSFITFSSKPELIELPEGTICDKVRYCQAFTDCSNTDIEKVYDLLLKVAKSNKLSKEEMIKRIIIISDMQFDASEHMHGSTFDNFKKKYTKAGFDLPELCFWNVSNEVNNFPVTQNESNVLMVSGSSQHTIKQVMSGKFDSPYEYMISVLNKYSDLDIIKF